MTNKELAKFLTRYNKWRQDDDETEMPHPKDISEAIYQAIAVIESHTALSSLLRRWMPVIEAHVESTHFIEGFNRQKNKYDDLLEETKKELAK